ILGVPRENEPWSPQRACLCTAGYRSCVIRLENDLWCSDRRGRVGARQCWRRTRQWSQVVADAILTLTVNSRCERYRGNFSAYFKPHIAGSSVVLKLTASAGHERVVIESSPVSVTAGAAVAV
ncbi:hypothetical protein BaRGS_00004071, partial [Batillaria attramentaria]